LRKANEALAKRRRAKKTRLRAGGALTVEDAQSLIAEKASSGRQLTERSVGEGVPEASAPTLRRCGRCGETGHNIRTCQEVEETSD
ncbi:hypothetical protein QBC35DRAFT_363943, partial [Podospora australis]